MRMALLIPCLLCLAVGCQNAELACVAMPTHTAAGVYGDLAIFGSGDTDYVWAINLRTGKVAWRHDPKGEVRAAPVIDGDIAYFWRGSTCRCPEHFWYRLFHSSGPCAVDCRTGNVLWRRRQIGFSGDSPIICGDVVVFTGCDETHTAYAYEKETGRRLWNQDDVLPLGPCGDILLCLRNDQRELVGLDPPTGEALWAVTLSDETFPELSVAIEEEVFVVALDRVVRRYEPQAGELMWGAAVPKRRAHVALVGSRCYAVCAGAKVEDGRLRLRAYDIDGGQFLQEKPLPCKWSGFYLRPSLDWDPIVFDDLMVLRSWSPDTLLAFHVEANELLWKFALPEISEVTAVGSSIFVGGWDGNPVLHQLDVRTGKILWSQIGEPVP